MLIINNVNMPVNQGTPNFGTYARVVEAWRTAVEALEKLLQGQPQRLAKGSVLLGLASWHLYPDLLVLGEHVTKVDFKDPISEDCAQLTIGLWNPDHDKDEGVYWSLSLSHLRFYGDPVKVTSFTTRNASRLNIDELHLLAIGAFNADWGSLCTSNFTQAAEFFVSLDEALCDNTQSIVSMHGDLNWINLFGNVSRDFLTLKDTEKSIASSLIALGQRRGCSLLSSTTSKTPPMMGLRYPWIQELLETDLINQTSDEVAVGMMRYFARRLELRHGECIIKSQGSHNYVTAILHEEAHRVYHINYVEYEDAEDQPQWTRSCKLSRIRTCMS
jgi:hypothetical protein